MASEKIDEVDIGANVSYPDVKFIDNPDAIKVLVDPLKREILSILRAGPLSVREVTERLKELRNPELSDITVQNVNYHIKALEKVGLISVAYEDKVPEHPHLTVKYYKRNSPIYFVRYCPDKIGYVKPSKDAIGRIKRFLKSFGYEVKNEDSLRDLISKCRKFEDLFYERIIETSMLQKEPTGIDLRRLQRYFRILSLVMAFGDPELRKLSDDIISELERFKGRKIK
ncbi:MAG: ArsR/SmtB family transcription factor [Candidatus Asgardarchaeia archaeon]